LYTASALKVIKLPPQLQLEDKAAEVITAYPELEYWAVGGHSLGGAMAARFERA